MLWASNELWRHSSDASSPTFGSFRWYQFVLTDDGANLFDLYRRIASFVDKILKGAKPANLPVEQRTKFGPIINRVTANTLDLTVPPTLLAQADEVIE